MATLTAPQITAIINAGQIVVIECNGLPVLIDQLADIPAVLADCGFSEKVLADYIIVGSPTNGQVPSWNSTTSKLQWSSPMAGVAWGGITGTLSAQTDLQSALNLKANLASPTFTGIPLTPTAAGGTNTTQIASTAFVRSEVSALINSAPSTLDTLNELATALGNDSNFATTITNSLAGKANLTDNLSVFAATTSLQLKNLISDETGSESLVFRLAPTLKNIVVNQNQNNDDMILATRATDSSPTGTFINYRNAAAGSLFKVNIDGSTTITANSGTIFAAGRQGTTNPAFSVISSGGTDTTGISVTSAAAGSGVTVGVTSSGTNENLNVVPKGAGNMVVTTNTTQDSVKIVASGGYGTVGFYTGAGTQTGSFGYETSGNRVFFSTNAKPMVWSIDQLATSVLTIDSSGRLLVATGTADAQLSVYSQSATRPSLKLNMPSGTAATQEAFGNYNNGTLTSSITANGAHRFPTSEGIITPTTAGGSAGVSIGRTNGDVVFIGSYASLTSAVIAGSGGAIGFAGGNTVGTGTAPLDTTNGVYLYRDAANTLAQRNGTNAQTFRVYNTYTDASNNEYVAVRWTSNIAYFQSIGNGTGTSREVGLSGTALRFLTSAGVSWQMSSGGHLVAGTDNTYDIGASGAARPRNYFGAGGGTFGGTVTGGALTTSASSYINFTSRTIFTSPSDGVLLIQNAAQTDFSRLQFGGTTSSFPALKRSSATLQVRLADDSDYAIIAAKELDLDKTVTAGGTTGAQTINKSAGTINFAAAANSVVVTNSLVTANSIIIATVATNDNLMFSVQAVAGSGSFTLYPDAAPFAETRVNFLVIN